MGHPHDPPPQYVDDSIFPIDQWQLRVPAIESLCTTFSLDFNGVVELCKEEATPTHFLLFRKGEGRPLKSTGLKDLTLENLSSAWAKEDEPYYKTDILFLLSNPLSERKDVFQAAAGTARVKGTPKATDSMTSEYKEGWELAKAIGWMARSLGVSPYFFDSVLRVRNVTALQLPPLRPSFRRSGDELDSETTLNGVYPIFNTGTLTTVWFSHSLIDDYSLYVVNNCAADALVSLRRFLSLPYPIPFMGIDAVLLDDTVFFHKSFHMMYWEADEAITRLDSTNHSVARRASPDGKGRSQGDLEKLYKNIYAIFSAYGDTKRTITLLGHVLDGIRPRYEDQDNETGGKETMEAAGDLLQNMEEIRTSRETTISNALAQLSTLMTFKVAVYSAQTAEDAKRDASSMTTIALVTMFFLPGSFVAAFFGTEFVKIPGEKAATTTPQGLEFVSNTWLYLAISVPLTLVVFIIWIWLHGSVYYAVFRKKWVVDRIQGLAGAFKATGNETEDETAKKVEEEREQELEPKGYDAA
ncbi:hypothetical protein BKA70DRAFT_1578610 [Coprinopsis sp. MPI-PUGE-AT-0042]|nr:hypothetical protein BKA70DRAFT_1578610 [Coprinopsis sp. MPI-PUGE-AT-0042]